VKKGKRGACNFDDAGWEKEDRKFFGGENEIAG